MRHFMKQEYLENEGLADNTENEKMLTEKMTSNFFHSWNNKLEVLTRVCDYYNYI